MRRARWLWEAPSGWVDAALFGLRLWCGSLLGVHGALKLADFATFGARLGEMGFPAPRLMALAAVGGELGGGVLLALGLATRAAAGAALFTMLVAAFYVHRHDPFLMKKEFALAYAAMAATVLVAGPGRFALDRRLFDR
jgi:putative oxidoreductase